MAESVTIVACNPAVGTRADIRSVERVLLSFGENPVSSDVSDIRRRGVGGGVGHTRSRGLRRPSEWDISPRGDDNCNVWL